MINIGQNVQNLDELNDNPNAPADGQNVRGNENAKKEAVNDKYKKFYDEV